MNFPDVLGSLCREFRGKVRFGVIGGVGVIIYGVPRGTLDVDLLIHGEDLSKADEILKHLGYSRSHQDENIVRYVGTGGLGVVDGLIAHRKPSLDMLTRVRQERAAGLSDPIPVVAPEDLIGLKVQAFSNDPSRKARDTTDIEAIAGRRGSTLDWKRIVDYYAAFGLQSVGEDLRRRHSR